MPHTTVSLAYIKYYMTVTMTVTYKSHQAPKRFIKRMSGKTNFFFFSKYYVDLKGSQGKDLYV